MLKYTMKFLNCVVFFCVFGNIRSGVVRNAVFRLDIVHYNDFHARFEETSVVDPVCRTNDYKCLGGFARLYYQINHLLAKKPGALLLNAGDDFQGTYWYTLLKDKVMSTFLNMLPNDAHALGNHEFDDGVAGLVPYLRALKDPVLVANMDVSLEPSLEGLFQPYVVLERKGRKIGIIGVTTLETKWLSNPGGVRFLDPFPKVQNISRELTDQGVDIIIVLSHCGITVDRDMAKQVGENVDIIVGGHTHSLLWNGTAPSNEEVTASYPVVEESVNKPGHKVLVVTASAFTKYLGYIGVDFNDNGDLLSFEAEPVFLNRSIPEDPKIKALLQPYMEKMQVAEVVATANADLKIDDCASGECAVGDIIAESYLDMAKEKAPTNLPSFSYFNRKMIRANIYKGDITLGDIITTLPYTNMILSFKLQGKYVKPAIEQALKTSPVEKNMPQIAGIKLTLNSTNNKIDTISVKDGEEWTPVKDDKEYQIVMPKFIKTKVELLNTHAEDISEIGKDRDAVMNYMKKLTPITPSLDGRLVVQN